jgi:hypothetical protein
MRGEEEEEGEEEEKCERNFERIRCFTCTYRSLVTTI